MDTFYKGCDILKDKVEQDYLKGKYFNEKTKALENITDPINKYNQQFLIELKDISTDFFTLISTEKIAIKLIEMNENAHRGDIGNLWNLIKSQSGTIRYNRALRESLKKYGITKRKLHDHLTFGFNKQKDRLVRNRNLVLELLKDYGLSKVLSLVESETGMNICEHIKEYALSHDINLCLGLSMDFDSTKEYYDNLENQYIEFLKDLAAKNGVNLTGSISDNLLKHREIMDDKHRQEKLKQQQIREENKINKALESMDKDNSTLFHDITAGYFDKMHRITADKAAEVRKRLLRFGGRAYYVAVCKLSNVFYIEEKGGLTKDIMKAKLLRTEQDGVDFYNEMGNINHDIKTSQFKVYMLVNPDVINSAKLSMVNNKQTETDELADLGFILSSKHPVESDKRVIKTAIDKFNGHASDSTGATFRMYRATHKNGNSFILGLNSTGEITFVKSYEDAIRVVPNSEEDIAYRKVISRFIKENYTGNMKTYMVDIAFNSEWYTRILKEINKHRDKLFEGLIRPDLVGDTNERKQVKNLIGQLDNYKNMGVNVVYFILTADDTPTINVSFVGLKSNKNGSIKQKRTSDVSKMSLYNSIEDAENVINTYFNESKTFCKIDGIVLNK